MNRLIQTILISFFSISFINSQNIGGTVTDGTFPVEYAKVCKIQSTNCTYTDVDGKFKLSAKIGDTIQIIVLGFKTKTNVIKSQNQNFVLQEEIVELETVVLEENKTKTEIKKEEGFSSEIIELGEYENTKTDINEVLKGSSGVVIRESGGLGADFNISLNGLSGKQVKFFIDGIPIDNYGSSFTPNNFPVNLIKSVEVYKGAVPIHLGSDALGGAINLITNNDIQNYLNATYSIGTFNTHRIGLNSQYTHKDFFIRGMGFFNYSDNNYTMDDIAVTDELGNFNDTVSVERFNDEYQSTLINLNAGVILKKWADRFTVGYSFNDNQNNVQHFLSIFTPFGDMKRFNNLHSASIHYEKEDLIPGLSIDAYSTASVQKTALIDTSSKNYDWFGNYTIREISGLGESNNPKSVFEFQDKILVSRLNLAYDLAYKHKLEFNYTQNYLQRVGTDSLDDGIVPFSDPHALSKHITGLSHNWRYAKEKGQSILFLKGYLVNYKVIDSDFSGNLSTVDKTDKSLGFGTAQSFKINDHWLAKFSYENAYRIPDAYEIFGDGFTLLSNTDLEAETSNNFNLGVLWNKKFKKFKIDFGENIFVRKAKNFITIASVGPFARYSNKDKVNIWGSETTLKITYNENYQFSVNTTYQSIRDSEGFRLANIPYLFGSLSFGYKKPEFIKKENSLHAFISANFREEFFLLSPSEGSVAFKNVIPSQLSLDATIAHSFQNERYQLSATLANIFNQKLYDNFRLQKPGRTFRLMFKYFLKSNK